MRVSEILQGGRVEWVAQLAITLLVGLCYHLMFGDFFRSDGLIGDDYSYFLPRLLDGYYWWHNNGLTPQLFTPAFCGGLPAFANPQSFYYSTPQLLTLMVNPLQAVYLTALLFAMLGYGGFYLLLRHSFALGVGAATVGAVIFAFNGFYSSRMLVGHLTFHGFMLLPWICLAWFWSASQWRSSFGHLIASAMMALLLGYTFFSGMVNGLLPMLLAMVMMGLVYSMRHGDVKVLVVRLLMAGMLSLMLTMAKFSVAMLYLSHFPRDEYLLPGIASFSGLISVWFQALFLGGAVDAAQAVVVNNAWTIETPDFVYSVGFVPLLLLLLWGLGFRQWKDRLAGVVHAHTVHWLLLLMLLLLPLLLNYYSPAWNGFLKSLPIIGSSSNLLRMFVVYVPLLALLAAVICHTLKMAESWRNGLVVVAVVLTISLHWFADRSYYQQQHYSPQKIVAGYQQAQQPEWKPYIERVVMFRDEQGLPAMPVGRDDVITERATQLYCYEPMFGYRMEAFPRKNLEIGGVSTITDWQFNVKNPACYLFGEENECLPGDHIRRSQWQLFQAFVQYQPTSFQYPWWVSVVNGVSLLTFIGLLLVIVWGVIRRLVAYYNGKPGAF